MSSDDIVRATAARIFRQHANPQTLNAARDDDWKAVLWRGLEEAGLPLAWVPDDLGGAGGGIGDGFDVLRAAGAAAVAAPVAETLLAGWLLAAGDIACPAGPMTVAPARATDRLSFRADGTLQGRLRQVPFASEAHYVAALASRDAGGDCVLLLRRADLHLEPGRSIAGDASDTLVADGVQPAQIAELPASVTLQSLLRMGATARSVQIAAALQTVLAMTVQYANDRIAFERPLAKFQAIQHSLARLAGEVAAAEAAAGSAANALAQSNVPDAELLLEVAAAKIRTGEAAAEGAAIAHQVFGAIGFTQEHVLHRYTRRMWAWRDDFGNESEWAVALGNRVASRGADALWPLLAAR